jgi:hypothetical protein
MFCKANHITDIYFREPDIIFPSVSLHFHHVAEVSNVNYRSKYGMYFTSCTDDKPFFFRKSIKFDILHVKYGLLDLCTDDDRLSSISYMSSTGYWTDVPTMID